jgi:hypothetical protein
MKKEYYNDLFGGKKYGDYMVYDSYKSQAKYSDYEEFIGDYYNIDAFKEESEEQKAIREAKEKAEKRNSKIDQLLGE